MTEGVCDFAENDAVQPKLIPYLAAQPNLRVVKSPGTTYQYLIFNFRDPRLRDLRVRRAISYAIDREQIVNTVLRGIARPATGMLAPENWAHESGVMRYPYDPAAARRLLEDAGGSQRLESRRLFESTDGPLARSRRCHLRTRCAPAHLQRGAKVGRRGPAVRIAMVGRQSRRDEPPAVRLSAVSQRQPRLVLNHHAHTGRDSLACSSTSAAVLSRSSRSHSA